jgi:Rps23 Pro-64 3,4-dihydroxylase Tpa1-like proline 4-hydroxylase
MKNIINEHDWEELSESFLTAKPFNHVVIDNFFNHDFAMSIFESMPDYSQVDVNYNNVAEKKKLSDNWHKFPKSIYTAFFSLVSSHFVDNMRVMTQQDELEADYGLHGGGVHMHKTGDYLNVHLDYDIHPKMPMKRKLNIIIYMTPEWEESWGGHIELWSNNEETKQPKECIHKIAPLFNRAVIFDTTQDSWHGVGVSQPMIPPVGVFRKSLAAYYVIPTDHKVGRNRALFMPRPEQKDDESVMEFCIKRAGL